MSRAAAGGLGFRAAKSPHQKKRDILSDVSFLLVRVVIQHFSKNTVISMVLGHPNSEITCIPPS